MRAASRTPTSCPTKRPSSVARRESFFFDLYAAMDARIGKNLKPYLHDITHPNDAGAALWASLLERYLGV